MQIDLPNVLTELLMTYGLRLKQAMDHRELVTGQRVSRVELANVAGCSRQNIGMILTNAKGDDQTLSTASHAAVAAHLRVNPQWLLTGRGSMEAAKATNAPSTLTPAALEMAVLFDMIPSTDRVLRAKAFNLATSAILTVLQDAAAKDQASPDSEK